MEAPPNQQGTARYWCITVHKINDIDIADIVNDEEFGVEWIKTFFQEAVGREQRIAYFIGQLERGERGRLHLQCYLELRGSGGVRGSALRGMLGLGGRHAYAYPIIVGEFDSLDIICRSYDHVVDLLYRFEICCVPKA